MKKDIIEERERIKHRKEAKTLKIKQKLQAQREADEKKESKHDHKHEEEHEPGHVEKEHQCQCSSGGCCSGNNCQCSSKKGETKPVKQT